MDKNKLSWCNWSVTDKQETSAALKPDADPNGGWSTDHISASGMLVRQELRKNRSPDILYVATPQEVVEKMLEMAQVTKGDLIYDLGCGDGRVLRQARKRYGVRAIGYELNLLAYLKAQVLSLAQEGIKIRRRDFFAADLSEADVIFCYLFTDVMGDLATKLESNLKPGTVVVSCNFALPGFNAERILRPGSSLHNDPIYIYLVE